MGQPVHGVPQQADTTGITSLCTHCKLTEIYFAEITQNDSLGNLKIQRLTLQLFQNATSHCNYFNRKLLPTFWLLMYIFFVKSAYMLRMGMYEKYRKNINPS